MTATEQRICQELMTERLRAHQRQYDELLAHMLENAALAIAPTILIGEDSGEALERALREARARADAINPEQQEAEAACAALADTLEGTLRSTLVAKEGRVIS